VDSEILWRVAVVQVVAVGILSLILGLILPHSFFADWGWVTGPVVWLLCAWVTARVVGLPIEPVLARAVLAGIPSAIFVLIGLHWLGVVIAIALFAWLCAQIPRSLSGGAA
jgi:hypothetical protein